MIWQLCWNMVMMFHPPNCWSRWSSPPGALIYTSTTSHIVYYCLLIIYPLLKSHYPKWLWFRDAALFRTAIKARSSSSLVSVTIKILTPWSKRMKTFRWMQGSYPTATASELSGTFQGRAVPSAGRPRLQVLQSALCNSSDFLKTGMRYHLTWYMIYHLTSSGISWDSLFHDISLNIHTRYRAPCDSNHQINVMCPHPMIFIMNKQRMSVMYTTSPNPEIPMSYIIQSEPLKIILSHWWNIAWLKTFSLFYMGFFIFQLPGNIAPEPIANQQKGITSNGSIAVQIIPISNINTQWVL